MTGDLTDLGVCMCLINQIGWVCPMCTFLNKPTRPGCEICGCERPAGYKVPAAYQPDKDEVLRIQQEQAARLQYERVNKQSLDTYLSCLQNG